MHIRLKKKKFINQTCSDESNSKNSNFYAQIHSSRQTTHPAWSIDEIKMLACEQRPTWAGTESKHNDINSSFLPLFSQKRTHILHIEKEEREMRIKRALSNFSTSCSFSGTKSRQYILNFSYVIKSEELNLVSACWY